MRGLKLIGWVLARPFVWWFRVFQYPPFVLGWCALWAVYGYLTMEGFWKYGYPGLFLLNIVVVLAIGRSTRRMRRKTARTMAGASESRAVFLAATVTRGVPIETARRAADLVEAGKFDDAMSMIKEHLEVQYKTDTQ